MKQELSAAEMKSVRSWPSNIVSDEEADAYFAPRPRLSQISAVAPKQSQPMRGHFELEAQVAKAALHFAL